MRRILAVGRSDPRRLDRYRGSPLRRGGHGCEGGSSSIGEYEAAKSLLGRALAIQAAALGPPHVDVAYTLKNLATAEQWTGNYAEAKVLLEQANDSNAEALVDVDAWLATHASPR